MGLRVTRKCVGAVNPSLGSSATILGYHSASTGASWFCAQFVNSGASVVLIVISQFPYPAVLVLNRGGAAASAAAPGFKISMPLIFAF